MQDTRPLLLETDFPPLLRGELRTLQVNLGYVCNLSCVHCHVNAGPGRTESMALETVDQVLALLARERIGQCWCRCGHRRGRFSARRWKKR